MLIMPPPLWMPSQTGVVLSYTSYGGANVQSHNGTNYYIPVTRQAMGADDLQIIVVILNNKSTSNYVDDTGFSPPSGFTRKSDARATEANGNLSAVVYYMTGSTTQTSVEVPVDGDGNTGLRGQVFQAVIKGADTAAPFDLDPVYEHDFRANPNPASFSISNDGAMVFSFFGADDDSTITAEPYPYGYTDLGHASSFEGSDRTYIGSYKPDVASGTEDPGAIGMTSNENWMMTHFAIKPAA